MDDATRHELAMEIFDAVCDASPERQRTILDQRCGDDAVLRSIVESMLAGDAAAHEMIDESVAGRAAVRIAERVLDTPMPQRVGQFTIQREIGRGGMGVVYEAQQEHPNRRVALKIVKQELASPPMLRRFEHEATLLGQLEHPGIARIYEAGSAVIDGLSRPFIAMEFIEGQPLDLYVQGAELTPRQVVALMARVCDGVQAAHQKGIVHRDLKPGNIIVGAPATNGTHHRTSTVEDVIGQPRVLDFGIARALDTDVRAATIQTEPGQVIGTLAYMSPEQLHGDATSIDTRSDVFALGVILYGLLAGRPAYELQGLSIPDAIRVVSDTQPPALRTLNPWCRGDIDVIVHKAMDPDPERRYTTAAEVAEELRRFLRNEPIMAHPPSAIYQLTKFASRNRALVTGIAATAIALITGLAGTLFFLFDAQQQRDAARDANKQLQALVDYQSAMLTGIDVEQMGRTLFADQMDEAARVLADRDDADMQIETFEQVLSVVNATTIASRAIDASVIEPAITSLDADFMDEPAIQAELRSGIVRMYTTVGLPEKALSQSELELDTRRRVHGADDPRTMEAERKHCELLIQVGAYEDATRSARDLLSRQQRQLGDANEQTLMTHRLLAQALRRDSKMDEARAEIERALAIAEAAYGPTADETRLIRTELGESLLESRQYDEAEVLLKALLDESRTRHGEEHRETLALLGQLGRLHFFQNRHTDAAACFEQLATLLTDTMGADHPETLSARTNLSINLTEQRRFDDAMPIAIDTLERKRRVLGPDHPSTVSSLNACFRLMMRLERWEDATAYGLESLDVARRATGPDSALLVDALSNLSIVYHKRGRRTEAEEYARRTLDESIRIFGPESPRTSTFRQVLAKVLMSDRRYAEADDILVEILERSGRLTPKSPIIAGSLGLRVNVLIQLANGSDALSEGEALLAWCTDRGMTGGEPIGRCHVWIARGQIANGQPDAAASSLQVAQQVYNDAAVPESFWSHALADTLQRLLALRADATTDTSAILEAHARLINASSAMDPSDRTPILDEVRMLLQDAGITLDEN